MILLITCQNGTPLVGVIIEVNQNNGEIRNLFFTDANGNYNITNLVSGNDYSFILTYKDELINDQKDVDAVEDILSKNLAVNAFLQIAADINRSGTITAFDLVQLEQKITNKEVLNWRIVPAGLEYDKEEKNFVFPNDFTQTQSLTNYDGTPITQDFVGVKIGDVDKSVCN